MKFRLSNGKLGVKSSIQPDRYHEYLHKFLGEVSAKISPSILQKLVSKHLNASSWRNLNREVRKECDAYCAKHNIMTHEEFQSKWFYEGKMIGRATHGRGAEWVDAKGQTRKVQEPAGKKSAPVNNNYFEKLYADKDPWALINYPIAKALGNC